MCNYKMKRWLQSKTSFLIYSAKESCKLLLRIFLQNVRLHREDGLIGAAHHSRDARQHWSSSKTADANWEL